MSLIDLSNPPNTPMGMQPIVPGDSFDPHFPRPPYQTQLADTDPFVLQVQQFLKSSPLGVSYSETPDGIISSVMMEAVKQFQDKLNSIAHTSWNLINGNSISPSNFLGALKSYKEIKNQPNPINNSSNKDNGLEINKQFQKILSEYGYAGEMNGIVSPELLQAAKNAENIIGQAINKSVAGMIWNGTWQTSPIDLSTALQLIKQKLSNSGNNKQ